MNQNFKNFPLCKIEFCQGIEHCPFSLLKSRELKNSLENLVKKENLEEFIFKKCKGKPLFHNSFRISISGCPNSCSQLHIKDIGIQTRAIIEIIYEKCTKCGVCEKICKEKAITLTSQGPVLNKRKCLGCGECVKVCKSSALKIKRLGYALFAGGKLGRHPRLATLLYKFLSEKDLIEKIDQIIKFYKLFNQQGERLGDIIKRRGLKNFKKFLKERPRQDSNLRHRD